MSETSRARRASARANKQPPAPQKRQSTKAKTPSKTKAKPATKKVLPRKNSTSTEEDEASLEVAAKLLVEPPPPPDIGSPAASVKSTGSRARRTNTLRTNKGGLDPGIQLDLLRGLESEIGKGLKAVISASKGVPRFLEAIKQELDIDFESKPADNKIRFWGYLPEEEYEAILRKEKILPYRFAFKKPTEVVVARGGDYREDTSQLSSDEEEPATKHSVASLKKKPKSQSSKKTPTVSTKASTMSGTKEPPRFQVIGGVLHGKKPLVYTVSLSMHALLAPLTRYACLRAETMFIPTYP